MIATQRTFEEMLQDAKRQALELARVNPNPPVPVAPPSPDCEVCEDKGVIRYAVPLDHPNFGKLYTCPNPQCRVANETRAKQYAKMLASSEIPALYQSYTFDDWFQLPDVQSDGKTLAISCSWFFVRKAEENHTYSLNEVVSQVRPGAEREYTKLAKNWLVLQGDLGVGKTALAATLIRELPKVNRTGLFVYLPQMFEDIQGRYGKQQKSPTEDELSADELLDKIKRAPVLVLDEINVATRDGEATADKQRIFESIIRYRYGQSLPTVMTCNVNESGLEKMWGKRTVDVILAAAHWIPMSGIKLRKTAGAVKGF